MSTPSDVIWAPWTGNVRIKVSPFTLKVIKKSNTDLKPVETSLVVVDVTLILESVDLLPPAVHPAASPRFLNWSSPMATTPPAVTNVCDQSGFPVYGHRSPEPPETKTPTMFDC